MNYRSILLLHFIMTLTGLSSCKTESINGSDPEDMTQYVDPLIGTAHCRWFHVAPGANPFGMAKPGPSTDGHLGNLSGWEAVGYDFRHSSIEGFPNFHEFQVGGVVFMPASGKLKTIPGAPDSIGSGYRSSFDKKDEIIQPGYYSVILKDYGIKAEVTSTSRVSFHRYTYPAGRESHILFDIGNRQGERLWALAYPEYLSDFIKGQLLIYHDAGWLGDGIACSKYVSGVGTNQVPLAIAAAYMCGIRDFDVQKAYEASLKNEITSDKRIFGAGKMDVGRFVKYGYVPYIDSMNLADELWKFSCSHTLEYSGLDSIFIISQKDLFGGGTEIAAFAGIRKPYNHGNQPCLHTTFLFNHSGKPSKTQKWVRAICKDFYGIEGIHGYGFGQDEDQGQLGAWFVMAGIGLFDVKGLTAQNPEFGISSPLFDRITITLNKKYYPGKQFVIETENNTQDNIYIQSMSANNTLLTKPFVPFSTVINGGKITMRMGNEAVDRY